MTLTLQTSIYGGGPIADLDDLKRQITEKIHAIPVRETNNQCITESNS